MWWSSSSRLYWPQRATGRTSRKPLSKGRVGDIPNIKNPECRKKRTKTGRGEEKSGIAERKVRSRTKSPGSHRSPGLERGNPTGPGSQAKSRTFRRNHRPIRF
jgi:hypothetical protein